MEEWLKLEGSTVRSSKDRKDRRQKFRLPGEPWSGPL